MRLLLRGAALERAEVCFHLMLLALSVGTVVYVIAFGGNW